MYDGGVSATLYDRRSSATLYDGRASATLYDGRASATLYDGRASATLYDGRASATLYDGRASATLDDGAVVNNTGPVYITEMTTPMSALPGRGRLRSAATDMYDTPHTRTKFGDRAFFSSWPA